MATYRSASIDSSLLDDGTYTLEIDATDTGGRVTKSSVSFTVANHVSVPSTFTVYVEVEFDAGVWTDLASQRVLRAVNTKTGRDQQLDTFSAGTATFEFTDLERLLDPANTAGAYYGKLVPRKRIRFRAAYASTMYPLWQGYIDSYEHSSDASSPKALFCTITATDGFKMASLATLGKSVYELEVAQDLPSAWWPLTETQGDRMTDVSGFGYHGRYSAGTSDRAVASLVVSGRDDTSINFHVNNWATFPLAAQIVDPGHSVEFWVKTSATDGGVWQIQAEDGSSVYTIAVVGSHIFAHAVSSGAGISATSGTDITDNRPHHVVVTVTDWSTAPTIYVDGVDDTHTTTATGTVVLKQGRGWIGWGKVGNIGQLEGVLGQIAVYQPELSTTRIAAHYSAGVAPYDGLRTGDVIGQLLTAIGVDDTDMDLDAGVSVLGSVTYDNPSALSLLQDIEATEQGRLWVAGDGSWTFRSRHYTATNGAATTSRATFTDQTSTFGSGSLPATYADLFIGSTYGDWFSTTYFEDSTAGFPYQSIAYHDNDDLIQNVVTATGRDGVTQTVEDQSSIDAYGPRAADLGGGLWRTKEEPEALARWRLARYKDPQRRYESLTVKPQRAPSVTFPVVFGRSIADRISVVHQPGQSGAAWSVDVLIEGIAWSLDAPNEDWTVTFSLGPTDPTNLFKLGSSMLDGTDGLAA